jgi:hypothetical protein
MSRIDRGVNPDTDTSANVLSDGFAEYVTDSQPIKQPATQPASLKHSVPQVPLFESPGSKRPAQQLGNWLTDASEVRKRAASDAARVLSGIPESTDWARDMGGVYTNKITGSFYTLDFEGKNPGFVCGTPYDDPYFKATRVWETLEQRVQAIQSHKMLLEMRGL